ncbi:TIR domain-containing protein [Sphingomonas aurantiaca]|uniref:TIR domain-containing protein n=1 Tax=Sphingomonas aurantiaca TaxID=185949 RepID=UPI003351B763
MADVYLIYSRRDPRAVEVARQLAAALEPRWTVWFDAMIVGDFVVAIRREMAIARCAIPIWSASSEDSQSVRDELDLAKRQGVGMLPAMAEPCDAPYGYGQLSMVDLQGWDGNEGHPGYRELLRKLELAVPRREAPRRPAAVAGISLPSMFLSVSSHETRLKPLEAITALRLFGVKTVLVSAYDLHPSRRPEGAMSELAKLRGNGATVLVDSGNYEAYRRSDETWTSSEFVVALQDVPCDHILSFDVLEASRDPVIAARDVVAAATRDAAASAKSVIPIVHAPSDGAGSFDLRDLPQVVREVAEQLEPMFIAIPERELGPGLMQSAATVKRIRWELDKLPFYQPIHLLGTGHPWSIAIFAAAGADSFDGLEWCRVVADGATGTLHHFQHFDFFSYQAAASSSDITVQAFADPRVDFAGKVAFHNLDVLTSFARELQEFAGTNRLEALVRERLGRDNSAELVARVPELFR